jgi:hypothetical protein
MWQKGATFAALSFCAYHCLAWQGTIAFSHNWLYPTTETRVPEAGLERAHLVAQRLGRRADERCAVSKPTTMTSCPSRTRKLCLLVSPSLMPRPYSRPSAVLTAPQVLRSRGPRTLHPLGREADDTSVPALGDVAKKSGADDAVAD